MVADASGLVGLLDHSLPKTFRRGTHRTLTPEETVARVRPLAARLGITRLGNITGLDRIGIPVAIAVRPNARSVSVSQGKGLALPYAMASALMEAAEGFHAEAIGDAPWRVAADRALRGAGEPVIDVAALCGTGTPLDPDTPIGWLQGHDLLRREPCWVPAELVHTDTTRPLDGYFPAGSNGLASGNHLGEAVGAALCELVERDAIAQWDAAGVRARAGRALDLASVEDAACRALLTRYAAAGIVVRVWDITTDVGIAAFLCHIGEAGDGVTGLRRFRGAGCHPDRGIALARALTEAAQVRLTYIAGIRDDLSAAEYDQPAGEAIGAALLDALAAERRPVAFGDVPNVVADDCIDDVRFALERLRAVGLSRVVALDLSDTAFAIPVVRLVIPGLEGDPRHPLYTPGPRARRAAAA